MTRETPASAEMTGHRDIALVPHGDPKAFSLVEMLVAMAAGLLALLLLGSLFRLEALLVSGETSAQERRDAIRRVVASMAREIRVAGHDPVEAGSFDGNRDGVFHAEENRLELRSDVQGNDANDPPDGELDDRSRERITFLVQPSTRGVSMKVGNQSIPLLAGVTADPADLHFEYLDTCGDPLLPGPDGLLSSAQRREVRSIVIRLRVTDESGRSDQASTRVVLRNRLARQCTTRP